MMNKLLIRTEELSKMYAVSRAEPVNAVSKVSMEVGKGEVVVLQGPNGSGKTSLLCLIGCISRPTSGQLFVKDKDVAKLPERFLSSIRRETFGFVFQQFHLIHSVSVLENVMLPLYPTGEKLSRLRERAEFLLERLGIIGKKDMHVQKLSGGEQQRTAIARALVNDSPILIADEPTAHLDTAKSEELIDFLRTLKVEGKTLLIATHDPLVYEQDFVDRVITMRNGSVQGNIA